MKTLLWIGTILFFLLSWWWYVCPHKKVCPFGNYAASNLMRTKSLNDVKPKEIVDGLDFSILDSANTSYLNQGKILFEWSQDKPYSSDAFKIYRDSIVDALGDSDMLEIVGNYYRDEVNSTPFPNLGYARANKIKLLFSGFASDRFSLKSYALQGDSREAKTRPFLASAFRHIVNNASVREFEGKIVINFPHASDEMLENMEINAYLDDLMVRLRNSEEKILLVGHTDNTASTRRNISLGWKRADAIRNLLLRKGLSSSRIITDSRGEAEPIASNNTPDGRRQNRRVEVTFFEVQN